MRIECRLPLGVRRYDTAKDWLAEVDGIINGKQARKAQVELFLNLNN